MSHDTKIEKAEELLSYYRNASATYFGCIGHSKANENRFLTERYAEELQELGVDVPSRDDAARSGEYNGVGSA